ncbi:diaminopimelate epimerase [Lederbergia sp. NSJ-179]|uniref:diaminopimelate epimerase n=1 Tax=Lederbergia sp. NSJ-179 TaxID=2931402 RepID=UPI001FD09C49|nr:diaminopimelate epimerase [Lederbergia sp. NSJ-179]MCJ7842053.1 diaminopimelate epimerase [Lederbergia sp. NSJ-179]
MLFTKMHGLGNSYVIFNELDQPSEVKDYARLSRIVSDRNFGIGSDGIILIQSSRTADFQMRIFNEDGSEGLNCGNGLRCVAKYLYDHMFAATPNFTIETKSGVVGVEVETNQQRRVQSVTVDMGEPRLLKGMIPMQGDPFQAAVNEPYSFLGDVFHLTCVSMGNPHAILYADPISEFPLETVGPMIETSQLFPERVNVGVVEIINRQELIYRVWERGSGITMACGTGACAAVVASTLNQLLDRNVPITVHLPGGDLNIHWDEFGHVWKKGAAAYICHGEWEVDQTDESYAC